MAGRTLTALKLLFRSALWLLALGVIAVLVLRWFTGSRFAPVRLVDYFTPWLLVPLLPALAAALVAGRRWLSAFLLVPVLYVGIVYAPLFLPAGNRAEAKGPTFKVMSYNVWSHNPHLQEIAAVVAEERPDILLLQELTPERYPVLRGYLEELYPGQALHEVYDPRLLQAVFSRYPLPAYRALPGKGKTLEVVVVTPQGELTLYNSHFLRSGDWTRRHSQIASLLAEGLANAAGPVILAGDFNTSERTETYRLITGSLKNAHWEAGRGFGFTFPAYGSCRVVACQVPPMVRIDHIFYNDLLLVRSAGTVQRSGGADHLPVVAEFSMLKKGQEIR
ncbi:membrane protein [Desulfuromonas versatilis]|uniref:Membrane protein n=1 Tax=Desulfuromonas versatilis TaxID=2802975 RepID=A0ABN6DTH1_9BACT|nr:endonuclease/exonuclease/phosphatase family protein [Desulfuromonas versatilis]BCR03433.1 membrane protein [Desulfuromonas versatilis]